jgi:hypothetical protein
MCTLPSTEPQQLLVPGLPSLLLCYLGASHIRHHGQSSTCPSACPRPRGAQHEERPLAMSHMPSLHSRYQAPTAPSVMHVSSSLGLSPLGAPPPPPPPPPHTRGSCTFKAVHSSCGHKAHGPCSCATAFCIGEECQVSARDKDASRILTAVGACMPLMNKPSSWALQSTDHACQVWSVALRSQIFNSADAHHPAAAVGQAADMSVHQIADKMNSFIGFWLERVPDR